MTMVSHERVCQILCLFNISITHHQNTENRASNLVNQLAKTQLHSQLASQVGQPSVIMFDGLFVSLLARF